ncbi:unnamed protein product [Moneuplotes crassus]|uniref:EamA domain-containing protein n=1 Tax=Euplotes crassus TaxID=5936 RepID=A0AAD2CZI6_EUPCR|nr:unnamed protein product [Moneuplotes crassus]
MVCVSASSINSFWVYFIEHIAILLTSLGAYLVYRLFYVQESHKDSLTRVWNNPRSLVCCILSGIGDTSGNLLIIFSLMLAMSAKVSPSSVSCLLMSNNIAMLLIGIYVFHEKHTLLEYFGAFCIFCACIVITLQKGFNNDGVVQLSSIEFYLSIFLALICAIAWGMVGFAAKWASYFYEVEPDEYAILAMTISGIIGICSIFFIYPLGIEIEPKDDEKLWFYILSALGAGFFTTFGVFTGIFALHNGSVEVTSLFANMRVIPQIIEEYLLFGIIPSIFSSIGILIALFGCVLMVFSDTNTESKSEIIELTEKSDKISS